MPISLRVSELSSRTERQKVGERTINPMSDSSPPDQGGIAGIVTSFIKGIAGLGGFLVSKITGFFSFSWTKFWGFIVQAKQYIWNFNWNATDAQLDTEINNRFKQLAIQLGGATGNALGWLFCGVVPAATIMAFNEPLGAYALKAVTEEGLEELADNFGALFKQLYIQGTIAVATWAYKSVRKVIKSNAKFVGKIFGAKIEYALQAWGEKDSKPWSFAMSYENALEKIPNATLREAVEEFGEEFDEACTEAGYVIANSVDTFYAQKMLEKQQFPLLGEVRYVEITPNRNLPDNKIILGGDEELLKPLIIQTLANNQQLGDRDIGTNYGTNDGFPVRSIKPEVVLKFYQAKKDRIIGKDANGKPVGNNNPLMMQISFRLMNKDETDFTTETYAKELAAKIYSKFGKPPFKINKGMQLYTYSDFAKGYQMILWVESQNEARKVVKQVLDIQNHVIDDELLRIGSKPVAAKTGKNKKQVLGKIEEVATIGKKAGIVTFTHAILNIGNGTQPINLVDLTGRRKKVVHKNTPS